MKKNLKPYSFKCEDCKEIITFGVEGTLSEPPPCCMFCGGEKLTQTDEHNPITQ